MDEFDGALARLRGASAPDEPSTITPPHEKIDSGWKRVKEGLIDLARQCAACDVDALGTVQYHARHLVMEIERDGPDVERTFRELREALDYFDVTREHSHPVRASGPPLPPPPGPPEPPRPPRHRSVR